MIRAVGIILPRPGIPGRDQVYAAAGLGQRGPGQGTAERLAFSASHGITADIELLPSARAQEALTRLDRGDVRYRFVLDLSDLG